MCVCASARSWYRKGKDRGATIVLFLHQASRQSSADVPANRCHMRRKEQGEPKEIRTHDTRSSLNRQIGEAWGARERESGGKTREKEGEVRLNGRNDFVSLCTLTAASVAPMM